MTDAKPHILTNPMASLPSVLAIRDLQRRLHRSLAGGRVEADLVVGILKLDPLAVARGLRAANASVYGPPSRGWSVPMLAHTLGPALSRRLLDTVPVNASGTADARRLWMHAIATAHAAEELAAQTQIMEREQAYLLGLLHDLPEWLRILESHFGGSLGSRSPAEWFAHWQMPGDLVDVINEIAARREGNLPSTKQPADAASLVLAAELLAQFADYAHGDDEAETGAILLAGADRDDLLAAQRLRRQVEASLRAFGLDPTVAELDLEDAPVRGFASGKQYGGLDDVVLNVLGCSRSESYRGIVTALCAAAVRYGGYDRALYVKWDPIRGPLTVRSKADSSSRRVVETRLVPSADEAAALRSALLDERPVRLQARFGRREGILQSLSADELLAVPVNRSFSTPAFLLLDRAMTLQPITLDHDAPMGLTLGLTGSLLNENLLLRRRQQRAQKFALTDALTRLFNRRMGLAVLDQEVARAARTSRPLTVLMCDLDHFKHLNDTHGHLQGDIALQVTADVLRQTLRKSDTICRYGGEEFLVVLPDTTPDEATVLATRLFTSVQGVGQELQLPITVSIGLTSFRPNDTAETILQRADHALYASKDLGRNRFSADLENPEEAPVRRD